jgi:hypothetical protein
MRILPCFVIHYIAQLITQQPTYPYLFKPGFIANDLYLSTITHDTADSHFDRILYLGEILAAEWTGLHLLGGQISTPLALISHGTISLFDDQGLDAPLMDS